MGLSRPRARTLTRQNHIGRKLGHYPLSQIVDRVELRADARSSHPFLFTNPTAVSKTLSPSHTRGFRCDGENLVRTRDGLPPGPKMAENPPDLARGHVRVRMEPFLKRGFYRCPARVLAYSGERLLIASGFAPPRGTLSPIAAVRPRDSPSEKARSCHSPPCHARAPSPIVLGSAYC